MKKIKTVINSEIIYLFIYFIYTFFKMIESSLINIPTVFDFISLASIVGLIFVFFMKDKIRLKEFIIKAIIILSFIIASIVTKRTVLIIYGLIIICSDATKFRKIVKTSITASAMALLIPFSLSIMGIIPNMVFQHNGMYAYGFGYAYYGVVPYVSMFIMIMYMYLRKTTLKWIELIICFAFSVVVYKYTTTRLSYYLSLIIIALYIIMVKFNLIEINNKFIRFFSKIAFPITFLLTLIAAMVYDKTNNIWVELNEILSNRLILSHQGLMEYDIKLFGQHIKMVNDVNSVRYFYLDSGFIYASLGYGLVFLTVILVMYSFLFNYSCKINDKVLFIWIFAVLLFTIVNNVWTNITYNPLLLLFGIALKNKTYIDNIFQRNKKYRRIV